MLNIIIAHCTYGIYYRAGDTNFYDMASMQEISYQICLVSTFSKHSKQDCHGVQ